jgi:hypothetical protein
MAKATVTITGLEVHKAVQLYVKEKYGISNILSDTIHFFPHGAIDYAEVAYELTAMPQNSENVWRMPK